MLDVRGVLQFLHHSLHAHRIAKSEALKRRSVEQKYVGVDSSLKCNHKTRRVCEKVAGGRSEAKTTGQGKH
jgi:hypothetical protein